MREIDSIAEEVVVMDDEMMDHRIITPRNPSTTLGNKAATWSTMETAQTVIGMVVAAAADGTTITRRTTIRIIDNNSRITIIISRRSNDPEIIRAVSTNAPRCVETELSPADPKDPVARETTRSTPPKVRCPLKPVLNSTLTPHSIRLPSAVPPRISP